MHISVIAEKDRICHYPHIWSRFQSISWTWTSALKMEKTKWRDALKNRRRRAVKKCPATTGGTKLATGGQIQNLSRTRVLKDRRAPVKTGGRPSATKTLISVSFLFRFRIRQLFWAGFLLYFRMVYCFSAHRILVLISLWF